MLTKIQEPISVVTIHQPGTGLKPYGLTWRHRPYRLTEVGMHYKKLHGQTLHHIYTCTTDNLALTLDYDTDTLEWTLTEISDINPD